MQETNSRAVLKKLTVQQLEMIFIATEISTRASSHGSSLPFLFSTLCEEPPRGHKKCPVRSHCLPNSLQPCSQHSMLWGELKWVNQPTDPAAQLSPFKIFWGWCQHLSCQHTCCSPPSDYFSSHSGTGHQTEWEIGRSWERNCICSAPEPQRQNHWAPFTFIR